MRRHGQLRFDTDACRSPHEPDSPPTAPLRRDRSQRQTVAGLLAAQLALSQNLAALEDDLGAKLVERHACGVALSLAGERVCARALTLLADVDELKDDVAARKAEPAGAVRLSLIGSLSTLLVALLMQQVASRFPAFPPSR